MQKQLHQHRPKSNGNEPRRNSICDPDRILPEVHVDKADPPLLWYHGDQDPQMPVNQALEMLGAYKKQSLPATFEPVFGGAHGGKLFYTPEQLGQVATFLQSSLKK